MSWQAIASKAQSDVLSSIPPQWRLPMTDQALPANVLAIPRTCGLLSPAQLEITEQTASSLVQKLSIGQLTSVEVTTAFCARAAIAHQLTNCLTALFPGEALEAASKADAYYKETGKTLGKLHGLPIAINHLASTCLSLTDMHDVAGKASTIGYISWHSNIATKDSNPVRLIRSAGGIIFAKTTMPQTAMALETTSNLFGTTVSSFNSALVCGGSSGGDGALIAMHGCPISPSSDIGGSIRVPAAFNGLYSIRPSADRISKTGLVSTVVGNLSIKSSVGPVCHSVKDVKMFTEILNAYPEAQFEPEIVPLPWKELNIKDMKLPLSFGYLEFDGVCMPHPPILRALRETAKKLVDAGHEVFPIKLPFDCWDVALTTWRLYSQTGFAEGKAALAAGGEELIPSLVFHLKAFDIKALTITELFAANRKIMAYKTAMSEFWGSTASQTKSGRPIDGIIMPVHPSASYPHNFPTLLGYTTLLNILDYPSTTIPIKDLKISADSDPVNLGYQPLDNPFDGPTHEMYDPQLFASQPVCLQLVGRPFMDEDLIVVSEVFDAVVNP